MSIIVIVEVLAVVGSVLAMLGSVAALVKNRPNHSMSSLAHEGLTRSLLNLSQDNEGLRARIIQKDSYIGYLWQWIYEHCSEHRPLDFGAWRSADLDSDIGLSAALVAAFDLAGFDQMLRVHCGRVRERITTANGLDAIVFDVVRSAEREGWLPLLKRGALAANPTNEQLQQIFS
jgi:hypothetical protein